ncbi:MAG TPA: nucleotidyltransferase [Phycisphaerales bacterium]|nr:nucleotidyltransferase [Phycisphaerales bacterium]
MVLHGVAIPEERLAAFCRRHGIARCALFGSILTDRFRPESDIDMLVEFAPGRTPGLLAFAGMASELSEMLGRPVDLRTPGDLSQYFRSTVLANARTLHAA